ncbi:hypothetical protein [Ornithinibacillus contaminans]|uniref:hypothetical protein n=1 Tax=Ornithinibacillus contaminans TaxID=694055 RepID=UPI00064D76B2|nr:hypothetical protein [Ornithinibacillus contaminans]
MNKRKIIFSALLGIFIGFLVIPVFIDLLGVPSLAAVFEFALGEPTPFKSILLALLLLIPLFFYVRFVYREYKKAE